MRARVYLLTEGVHDVYFLAKVLAESFAFKKVEDDRELDPEWETTILPKQFPYNHSLRPSVPAPSFYKSDRASVAIVNAEGIERLGDRLKTHHGQLMDKGVGLDAVGVVLDADFKLAKQKTPAQRFAEMADVLASLDFPRPAAPDAVAGTPRTGIYVLPGGGELGTLEDILLECAAAVYPTLGCRAVRFIDGLDREAPDFKPKELKEAFGSPSGRHKAVLAAMTAVLKPGKPTQASIEDHRWIEPRTLALPRVAAVAQFLKQLIETPPDFTAKSG
jgi:hypothetical protein